MKSVYRCKENYQGDRCLLAKEHEGNHFSNNAEWGPVTVHHRWERTSRDRFASRFLSAVRRRFGRILRPKKQLEAVNS